VLFSAGFTFMASQACTCVQKMSLQDSWGTGSKQEIALVNLVARSLTLYTIFSFIHALSDLTFMVGFYLKLLDIVFMDKVFYYA
jgi:hypothetical protein